MTGYVEPDEEVSFNYVFQYKDHLGNVRLSYSDINNNGQISPNTEILQERNYYPFGLEHRGYNNIVVGAENNHKTYQSKELEKELGLGWHDFGARRYMADIGRWTTLDALSEKFYPWSPYNAMLNNPVKYVDPDGRMAKPFGDYYDTDGNYLGNDGIDDNKVYQVSKLPAVSSELKGSTA